MPRTEEQKARRKELDLINKDKIREQQKAYHLKHKDRQAIQRKAYDLKNKDRIFLRNKAYNLKYKIERALKKKARDLENKVKIDLYNKEYNLKNHKKLTITKWKILGLICDNYESLYDHYISVKKCEICCVELTIGKQCKTRRAMDHSHSTGEFRNVLCNNCNLHLKE